MLIYRKTAHGFTIVELLIVIVVIAILATISIVAYNGIQERARYAKEKSDLTAINKAIQLYYTDKGYYPYSSDPAKNVIAFPTYSSFDIPGLAPDYINKVPLPPNDGRGGYYAYIWTANGGDYKLVRLVPGGVTVPSVEQSDPNPDANRPGRGWGYWSPNGSAL